MKKSVRLFPYRRHLALGAGILVAVFGVVMALAVWQTVVAVKAFRSLQFSEVYAPAQRARTIVQPLSALTLHLIPELEIWRHGVETLSLTADLATLTTQYIPLTLRSETAATVTAAQIKMLLPEWYSQTTQLTQALERSAFARSYLHRKWQLTPLDLQTTLRQFSTLTDEWLNGEDRALIFLQNTDEVRATGGFMGSYLLISSTDGVVSKIEIQDIYEADGQIKGFVEAPAGVKEYLSGGKGWHLPDANWSPDFPSSAIQIRQFWSSANLPQVTVIGTVNLQLVEEILSITGGVFLPEYGITVTAENLATVARVDRNQFFPGSKQKISFLESLITHLKIQFESLSNTQVMDLATLVQTHLPQKSIQIYSEHPATQQVLSELKLTGEVQPLPELSRYLMLVESNVGINKVNRFIQREVHLTPLEEGLTFDLLFKNTATPLSPEVELPPDTAPHMGYVNYQRILVNPDTQVHSISVEDKALETWDEEIIVTHTQKRLKQIGFLVTVPEQTERQVHVVLTHPFMPSGTPFLIQKQSGLPATPYTLLIGQQISSFLLEKDEVLFP